MLAKTLRQTAVFAALLLAVSAVNGQVTYRWIDAKTGRAVISDQPPPAGARQVITYGAGGGSSESGEKPALSYATRQASEKFPVVLYTASDCDECREARDLLAQRGIPFSEKVVKSQAEFAEINQQLGGKSTLPSVLVGRKSLRGFAMSEWNELLDLAGYPASTPYGSRPRATASE